MLTNNLNRHRRYRTRLKPFCKWPELTALLDVLFLVLLFFALSSSFIRIPGIAVELPRLNAPGVANLQRFVVSIAPAPEPGKPCVFYFKDRMMTLEELKQEFFKTRDDIANEKNSYVRPSVVICADHRVPFDTVAQVMAIAESAALSSFIAVMPQTERREVVIEK